MGTAPPCRRGHAGICAIIEDMATVLPPENTTNPAYMRIHTTFGLIKTSLNQAETDADPGRQYKELQKLEQALRKRLHDLKAKKGIPEKMQSCLDELRDAINEALRQGIDLDFMIQGLEAMLAEPEPTLKEKMARTPQKLVSEKRVIEVLEELKETKAQKEKLNKENNDLALRLKMAEAEVARLKVIIASQRGDASEEDATHFPPTGIVDESGSFW